MSERETMTTPNFTPDVPQWNEPMRYEIPYSNGCAGCPRLFIGTRWIGEVCGAIYLGHDSEKYAARIVSLWNEAIATPVPAATDAVEVQATPKWPRYLMPRGGVDKKLLIKFTAPGIGGLWADGLVTQGLSDFDYYLKAGEHIETDAAGNALTQPTEHQQASGVEECNTQLPADRASDAVTLARAAETSHPSQPEVAIEPQQASGVERYTISGAHTFDHSTYVTAADHDRVVAEKDAAIAEYAENLADTTHDLQDRVKELAERDAEIARLQDALDENWTTHQQIINARTVRNGEYDKLHAMLVAEQQEHGRTGVERNEYAESCKHWRERAEAADAKCAAAYLERDDILAQKGEVQGDRSREVKNLTAQLAAANERVAALEKERDELRKALSYLHERLTEYKNGEAMIYADARGDIAVIEKALAQPSAEVGE